MCHEATMSNPNKSYQDVSWMFPKPPTQTLPATQPAIDTRLLLEKAHRPAQQEQIKTLVLSAWIIGGCVALVAVILGGAVAYLTRAPYAWLLLPLGLIAGILIAAVLSIMWIHKAAVRAWQLEDIDRAYRLRDIDDLYDLRHNLPGAPARDVVRVELTNPLDAGYQQTQLIDLPTDRERLELLARGLLAGLPFSEAQWSGGQGIFTRSEFSQLRAELIKRGLASWNNPHTNARGAQLTPSGRAIMRRLGGAPAAPYPLPQEEDL
jgi:hypothetical protein